MKHAIYIFCIVMLSISCKKLSVVTPNFDVSVGKTTYKVGDTVSYQFVGDAHSIIFYSGEQGANYFNKDRFSADGSPQLTFSSYLQTPGEINTLRLLVSKDFNGKFDSTNVRSAHWDDITSRATLSTGADNTSSGAIDLSDYKATPVYFAFKYAGYNNATLKQPTWTLRTFNVNNILNDGSTYALTSIDVTGWYAIDFKNPSIKWVIATTGQPAINGTTANSTNDDNEDWIISRKLNLFSVVPDKGLPIKDISKNSLNGYKYVFTKPGNFKSVFVAFNNTTDMQKEVVKEIAITVIP